MIEEVARSHRGALLALAAMVTVYWWHDRPGVAGTALALSTAKPQFAVPLAILSALRRGGRRQWVPATAVAAAASLPLLVVYVSWTGSFSEFATILGDNVADANDAANAANGSRIDLTALVARVTASTPGAPVIILLNLHLGIEVQG